nr:MAG TPA: hypothetical protein [Caudoviricetes sp.]
MDNLVIRDAKIFFRNFEGREQQFNAKGDRNFGVFIDDDIAEALKVDGWNVKRTKEDEDGTPGKAYLKIKVRFEGYPPKVVLVTEGNKTQLDEEDVKLIDKMDIERADLVVSPYTYNFNGRTGISAYLKTGYFVQAVDEFADLYGDIPMGDSVTVVNDEEDDEDVPF